MNSVRQLQRAWYICTAHLQVAVAAGAKASHGLDCQAEAGEALIGRDAAGSTLAWLMMFCGSSSRQH